MNTTIPRVNTPLFKNCVRLNEQKELSRKQQCSHPRVQFLKKKALNDTDIEMTKQPSNT